MASVESKPIFFYMANKLWVNRAIKYMQRCDCVKDDGIIGKITMSQMHNVTEECLYQQRNEWYNYLSRTKAWAKKFIKGWLNRSKAILEV